MARLCANAVGGCTGGRATYPSAGKSYDASASQPSKSPHAKNGASCLMRGLQAMQMGGQLACSRLEQRGQGHGGPASTNTPALRARAIRLPRPAQQRLQPRRLKPWGRRVVLAHHKRFDAGVATALGLGHCTRVRAAAHLTGAIACCAFARSVPTAVAALFPADPSRWGRRFSAGSRGV